MKKLVIVGSLLLSSIVGFSQYDIHIEEKNENIAGASHNTFSVYVYESDQKEVEKALKSGFKDIKAKVKMGDEIFADDAKLKTMGKNTFDVYAKINVLEKGVQIITAVDLGGSFLNSKDHATQVKAYKDWLYEFAVQTTKEALQGLVKEAGKVKKGKEKEQEGLVKDKEKLEGSIVDYEKAIKKAKEDIKANLDAQTAKKAEIDVANNVVIDLEAKEAAVK